MRVRLVQSSPRLPRLLGAASLVGVLSPLLLRIVAASLGMQKPLWWATFVGASWVGALVAGLGALALLARRPAIEADVRAFPGGFAIDTAEGERRILEAELATVGVVAVGARGRIELRLRDGAELTLGVDDLGAAFGLVEQARLGQGSRISTEVGAARYGLGLGAATLFSFLFAVVIAGQVGRGAPSVTTAFTWLLGSLATFALAALVSRAPRIELGPDGLTVHARRGTRRVAHRALQRVEEARDGLRLVLADGSSVLVPIEPTHALRGSLAARLSRAITERDDGAASLLRRRGRAVEEWRAALVGLVTDEYRGVSPEDAARVLEAEGSTGEQRVGAALALAALPAGPARVRVAAEACVDPRMRVALEKAADGSLGEEELAFLEQEGDRARSVT